MFMLFNASRAFLVVVASLNHFCLLDKILKRLIFIFRVNCFVLNLDETLKTNTNITKQASSNKNAIRKISKVFELSNDETD